MIYVVFAKDSRVRLCRKVDVMVFEIQIHALMRNEQDKGLSPLKLFIFPTMMKHMKTRCL
jgi:hypothetical protein